MILVFGSIGQVGQALQSALADREAVFLGPEEADFTKPEEVRSVLASMSAPRAIINAAAFTAVDKAEEAEDVALAINATTPAIIAAYCREQGIPMVHYSTDYVYGGEGTHAHLESDTPNPLNAYARTKLKGDEMIAYSGCDHLIFRTSWVFDAHGQNFVNTMLRLGAERESLRVVEDQIGAPTYAPDIAQATVDALDQVMGVSDFPSGVYHLCNAGETSWCGFARAIFAQARHYPQVQLKIQTITGIPTTEYPLPAKRPLNSRLDCTKVRNRFGIRMPGWQEALDQCLQEKYGNH